MDEIRFAPNGNHGKPLFVGICRGTIIQVFLRWCRFSSIHVTVDTGFASKKVAWTWGRFVGLSQQANV